MTTMTHDVAAAPASRIGAGLGLAALSAASFGLSGALARGLLDAGWSAGAAVTVRVSIAAVALALPAAILLRGRWGSLRRSISMIAVYGVVAVAGCQLCYFYAIEHLQVGVALLIEYTAPVAVVLWMWLRHGQSPRRVTFVGAVVAVAGLVLVLDVVSGFELSTVGVLWALGAMAGAATYFVLSADEGNGLPPLVLAAGGLFVGALALIVLGAVGAIPMAVSSAAVDYRLGTVAWWVPLLGLGFVTAALAYTTGIAASRRLGSRLASFVALFEVLMALVFAWLLLGEAPGAVQLVGGVLVLAGVVLVKLGEPPASAHVQPDQLSAGPGV